MCIFKSTDAGAEHICLSKSSVLNPCKFVFNLPTIVNSGNGVKGCLHIVPFVAAIEVV